MSVHRTLILCAAAGLALVGAVAMPAGAAGSGPIPSSRSCSTDVDGHRYACLTAHDRSVPAGQTSTFTGRISPRALSNLHAWSGGVDDICLTRFATKPQADGSWPWQTLDKACTIVRSDGSFTLHVALSRPGTFFYGVEMGTCRADAGMCGDGDPGLLGMGEKRAVQVATT